MIKDILSGIQAYAGAFGLISKLKLWKYFAIPMIISVLTATIIGFTAYGLSDNIGVFLAKIWIWDWGKETVTTITSFVGGLVVLIIGLILYKHIILALSAPFMSPVSEKIEVHINGNLQHTHRKTSFQEQLVRGIRISIRNLSKELLVTIPILLLKFIPLVNIFSTILLFVVQSYYAGFGNMDYTLERHLKYKESIDFVGRNKGFSIGNGIVFMLCLLVPVIGIIVVLPLSVTAASVKTVVLLNQQKEA
ncbi:EI24 domain-containing protein [Polaribacter aquimarinus]|uniref:Coproporphyrinogen III oxidase n=1 Tax=Polaribacter aquimarinus TaxID=2100726 RepID=A0A2U2JDH3_9FLAO|nr:EI24 domain-containing protein [Polaribacter aquimarinus]PWG06365.1 coproporphyrinogen III oxidase [Polaribacter aquimarinus]